MSSLKINKLTPCIGAEISGIDFSKELTAKNYEEIYQCLIIYKVIFFRKQNMTAKNHINLAKSFGEIDSPHPVYPKVENYPEIVLLENDKNNPPDTDVWHTDVTFKSNPAFASILYSRIIPQVGGDTLWSSLEAIYDSIPTNMKKYLNNLKAIHDMGDFRNSYVDQNTLGSADNLNKGFQKFGSSVHPLIQLHPVTKKNFFILILDLQITLLV